MTEANVLIGPCIKKIRAKHKVTQKKLAKIMCIEETYLRQMELSPLPPIDFIIKIAKVFNIKLWEFFASLDDEYKPKMTRSEKYLLIYFRTAGKKDKKTIFDTVTEYAGILDLYKNIKPSKKKKKG